MRMLWPYVETLVELLLVIFGNNNIEMNHRQTAKRDSKNINIFSLNAYFNNTSSRHWAVIVATRNATAQRGERSRKVFVYFYCSIW